MVVLLINLIFSLEKYFESIRSTISVFGPNIFMVVMDFFRMGLKLFCFHDFSRYCASSWFPLIRAGWT